MKKNNLKVGILPGIALIGALAFTMTIPAFAQVGVSVSASANGISATGVTVQATATTNTGTLTAHIKNKTIATATARAATEITNRINALNVLSTRVNAMVKISSDDKTNLSNAIQAQITAMNQLQTQINADAAADATTSLKTDIQSITGDYRIYALIIPQGAIEAAADRILDIVSTFQTLGTKLQTRISMAQASGTDVTAMTTAYTDFTAKIADANTQANATVSEISSLTPDNGNATIMASNTVALKDARTKIQAGQQDLVAARKDAGTIVKALESIKISANASATVSATATKNSQ